MFTHRILGAWSKHWFTQKVILPFAATRIALCLLAWLGFHLLPLPSAFPRSWEIGRGGSRHFVDTGVPGAHPFINMWSRWDSGWYLEIARFGYHYYAESPSSTAFFPLYPLGIRALHDLLLLPLSDYWYLVVGIIVSNICLISAATYLHRLVSLDYSPAISSHAVLFLLLFPTSFFLSAAYSESMFLALTVGSFYYARKERWLIASALAAFATLCRSQGIILAVPLLVEYLAQRKFDWRRMRWNVAALGLIPAALVLLIVYFKLAFGSWTILIDSQKPWGRRLLPPWFTLGWVATHSSGHDWIDLGFFAFLVVIAVARVRQLRLSYSAYLVVAAVFYSCWGMLGSVPRLMIVIFPMFIVLSILTERNHAFRAISLTVCSILSAIFFFMHSQWNWVA